MSEPVAPRARPRASQIGLAELASGAAGAGIARRRGRAADRARGARGGRLHLARGRAARAAGGAVLRSGRPREVRSRVHGGVRQRPSDRAVPVRRARRDRAGGAAARRAARPAELRHRRPTAASSSPVPAAWSDVELLRHKDFATYTDAEMALARLLIAQLARRGPTRLSRRTRPSRRRGHTPDLRRVVRASLRTAGEPIDRHWRAPSRRPRPVVLVCDVSGIDDPVRADAAPVPARVASPRAAASRRSRSARG